MLATAVRLISRSAPIGRHIQGSACSFSSLANRFRKDWLSALPHVSRVAGRRAHGGVLLIPVCVNGQDFEFLVDTGSAYTALSSAAVAALRLTPQRLPERRIAAAFGGPMRVPTATVDQIAVGSQTARNLVVVVLNLPEELQLRGLLGMDYLGRFRVTLESDTATLVLRAPVAR